MDNLILLGAGGHCKSVLDSIDFSIFKIAGVFDNRKEKGCLFNGYPILGCDDEIPLANVQCNKAFITVGMIKSAEIRIRLAKMLQDKGYELINIIDPCAIIKCEKIGVGNYFGKGCIVNIAQSIGDNNIFNTGSVVEHGCSIGSYNHIAPHSTICGDVHIGDECLIGAGSIVIQERLIQNHTIVPAGMVIR